MAYIFIVLSMNRRKFLQGTVLVGAVAVGAGCLSGGLKKPDPDADPLDLLPESTDSWTLTGTQRQQAGFVGAESGIGADYTGPDGERYSLEILRWSSEKDAKERGPEVYSNGWSSLVTFGVFNFAANGPDGNSVRELLSLSPALSIDFVNKNDK